MKAPELVIFDAKSYDREYLSQAPGAKELVLRFYDFRIEPDTVGAAKGARAVCVFVNDPVGEEVCRGLAELGVKHLALRCAGYNNLDLAAAKRSGLRVTRVPSYSPASVAEHAVALLLCLNRKMHRAYSRVRDMNFSLNGLVGFDLRGKTAGIVGTGKIGRMTAEILRGFGMQVLAFDVHPDPAWAEKFGITLCDLETLFGQSDIISLHVPLLPETDHLINSKAIARMKRGVILINVSRGRLIHTAALIAALKSGHVGGVALDVYEEEEGVFFEDLSGKVMQDDELARLLTFPNVLVTAHQAFLTHEALEEIARVTIENVRRLAADHPPLPGTELT